MWTAGSADPPTSGGPGIGIDTATVATLDLPDPVTDIETRTFCVSLPKGWKVINQQDGGVCVLNGTTDEDVPYVTIQVIDADGNTPDDVIREMISGCNAVMRDDVGILDPHPLLSLVAFSDFTYPLVEIIPFLFSFVFIKMLLVVNLVITCDHLKRKCKKTRI